MSGGRKEYKRAWREANKEKVEKANKAWREANKEKLKKGERVMIINSDKIRIARDQTTS